MSNCPMCGGPLCRDDWQHHRIYGGVVMCEKCCSKEPEPEPSISETVICWATAAACIALLLVIRYGL